MKTRLRQPCQSLVAFTLIELLVVIAIIGVLAAIAMAVLPKMRLSSQKTACLSNMRQLGIAFRLYAGDNDDVLPQRVQTGDKWPKLLYEYTKTTKVLAAPGIAPATATQAEDETLLSNSPNKTSFIFNGFNDMGAFGNPDFAMRTGNIPQPAQTLLLGMHNPGDGNFYMDYQEGNHLNVVSLSAYGDGSNYVFADGSARFLKKTDYQALMWAVDKSFVVP